VSCLRPLEFMSASLSNEASRYRLGPMLSGGPSPCSEVLPMSTHGPSLAPSRSMPAPPRSSYIERRRRAICSISARERFNLGGLHATGGNPPYAIAAVTADPAEGETRMQKQQRGSAVPRHLQEDPSSEAQNRPVKILGTFLSGPHPMVIQT
jgi:hypothetical protein